jgi:hypothetical protein
MSTLQSVDVLIDGLQNDSVITAKDYQNIAKDYPPVVDHASVIRGSWNNTSVGPIDTIQGKMVTAQMSIDANQAIQMDDLELKNRLITKLVRELMNGKYIEFTKQQDVVTMETIIRARIFVTPDDQVRVIRKANDV